MTRRMVETGIYDTVSPQVEAPEPDPYRNLGVAICADAFRALCLPKSNPEDFVMAGLWLASPEAGVLFDLLIGIDNPLESFGSLAELRQTLKRRSDAHRKQRI